MMLPRRMYKKPTEEELLKKLNDYKERSKRREQGLRVKEDEDEEVDIKNVSEPTILYKGCGREIKYFPPGTINAHNSIVTKSGWSVLPCEVAALRLVNDHLPHLPIPRVHEAHRLANTQTELDKQSEGISFQMDYVQGKQLSKVWHLLQKEQKQSIIKQLREILEAMRSIPQASVTKSLSGDSNLNTLGRIGSCTDGGVEGGYAGIGIARDCRRISIYESDTVCKGEAEFNSFILNLVEGTPAPVRKALVSHLRNDHRIVFTHGDIALHNIIVDDDGQNITGLIDWEFAGWYPEYWDYIKFLERLVRTPSDWKDYADDIFPQAYHDELILYQAICRYQMP